MPKSNALRLTLPARGPLVAILAATIVIGSCMGREAGNSISPEGLPAGGGAGGEPDPISAGGQVTAMDGGASGTPLNPFACEIPDGESCPLDLLLFTGSPFRSEEECLDTPHAIVCSRGARGAQACWIEIETGVAFLLDADPCIPAQSYRRCTVSEHDAIRDIKRCVHD